MRTLTCYSTDDGQGCFVGEQPNDFSHCIKRQKGCIVTVQFPFDCVIQLQLSISSSEKLLLVPSPLVIEPNPLRTLCKVLFQNTALAPPVTSLLFVHYQLI